MIDARRDALDQDGGRDGEHLRARMHDRLGERRAETGRRWVLASGSPEARVVAALAAVDEACAQARTFAAPRA